ncbi:MAG: hypothetical protein H6729_14450 [Deltaproteobacteria bacterium]|nr:hypothetical protein [Deltaproteobacteria bacterium]
MLRIALIASLVSAELLASAPKPSSKQKQEPFNYTSRIGLVRGACFATAQANLSKDARVIIVTSDKKQRVVRARVKQAIASDQEDVCATFIEATKGAGDTFNYYVLSLGSEETTDKIDGFGIIASPSLKPSKRRGRIVTDLDRNGRKERFEVCNTSDGFEYRVIEVGRKDPLWKGYYYAGYDMEPNCP